jgi:hypothetical protein
MSVEHVRCTCFFNNMDKVVINNIKNSCASHMLLKKNGHMSLLQIRLKEIPSTQFGGKLYPMVCEAHAQM